MKVEICQNSRSRLKKEEIQSKMEKWCCSCPETVSIDLTEETGNPLSLDVSPLAASDPFYYQHIEAVTIYPNQIPDQHNLRSISISKCPNRIFHVYQLNEEEAETEDLEESETPACSEWFV